MSLDKNILTHVIRSLIILLIFISLFMLIPTAVHGFRNHVFPVSSSDKITEVTMTINGEASQITLPYNLKGLSGGESIELSFDRMIASDDHLFLSTQHTPVEIYINDQLFLSAADADNLPFFMKNPGPSLTLSSLYAFSGQQVHITIRYRFPYQKRSLNMDDPVITNASNIIFYYLTSSGSSLFFGLFLLILSFALTTISFILSSITVTERCLNWLSLFALLTGIWSIGSSKATLLFFNNPILVYLLEYFGYFTMLIPLCFFILEVTKPVHRRFLTYVSLSLIVTAILASLLQLFGIVMFTYSIMFLQIQIIVVLLTFIIAMLHEWFIRENSTVFYFLIPTIAFTFLIFLEFISYSSTPEYAKSTFFKIGIIIFFFLLCISGAKQIKKGFELMHEGEKKRIDLQLLNISLSEQLKRQDDLVNASEELRRKRHDFRHYLSVIREYNQKGQTEEINRLIEDQLKTPYDFVTSKYCENEAVNALVSYYASLLMERQFSFEFCIELPNNLPIEITNELCSIFGNLLENATEALQDLPPYDKEAAFLHLTANPHLNTYVIQMENSFSGILNYHGSTLYSNKRDEIGIGLVSIRGIAQKRKGDAFFQSEGKTFYSKIYLNCLSEQKDDEKK